MLYVKIAEAGLVPIIFRQPFLGHFLNKDEVHKNERFFEPDDFHFFGFKTPGIWFIILVAKIKVLSGFF